ncbi:fatty acid synthase [Dermacentor silvarum]|uniref:fatty acid synthase n=1 Tax=Dermacentor silvarum TaxID=543639 RepID=UPI002100E385|nr:fatty acid synthase [Dermacentor silvarum]
MGCTVFSTFSTREEYQFLKSVFPCLEDRHFIRSDDLYLDEQILKETGGRGANVVLNICNSEKLEASACSLACRGCVISVETYRSATKSSTRVDELCDKLKGVNVVHVEPDVLHLNNASALEDRCRVAKLLNDGIASGAVKPLISTCFPRDEAVEAFRLIANGNSKGKVLIQVRSEEGCSSTGPSPAFAVEALPRVYLYESKTYIIVGGLSDIALELAEWLIDRGCRKLLLNSPFGVKTGFQRFRIHKWQRAGVTVLVSDADTSTKEGASKIVQQAAAMGPVGGIYILLTLLLGVHYTDRNADELDLFIKLKVDGTIHLDELSRKCCPHLDHFLVFSSLCSSCGSPCDPYSGYADSVVERICENRVADELPGLAIQWGALEDGSPTEDTTGPAVTSDGTVPQRISSCLDVIERFLGQSHPVVSSLVRTNLPLEPHKTTDKMDLVCSVARVFGFRDPMNLDPTATLGDLGMDSAMGVDVQQLIEEECGLNLSVHEIRQLTIGQLLNIGGVKSDCAATLLKRSPTGA